MGLFQSEQDDDDSRDQPKPDWFDRILSKISSASRILLLFGVVLVFSWPVWDHDNFVRWTQAIATIPENLWLLIYFIVAGVFGAKIIREARTKSFMSYQETSFDDAPPTSNPFEEDEEANASLIRGTDAGNDSISAWKNKNASP